ncbi:MAG: hypothetical protein GX766_03755 [Firmicutes bacterium]|nr:hypothetical protein [Bacillota bacterium]
MRIIEDFEKGEVIINDIRIEGFIAGKKCSVCGNCEIYYEEYDSFFCAYCNEWAEEKCADPDCMFCSARPKKPL